MAETRRKLLESAVQMLRTVGYQAVTIDRIAENAGFSRGAFYAHFPSKIAIYTEILSTGATRMAPPVFSALEQCQTGDEAIAVLCDWADERREMQEVGFLLIDLVSHASQTGVDIAGPMQPLRENWVRVGELLANFAPGKPLPGTAEEIGALVLELAQGAVVESMGGPKPSRLMEVALRAIIQCPAKADC